MGGHIVGSLRKFLDFVHEVWRRRVFHVAIPYGVGSWLLLQVAELVLEAFSAPAIVLRGLLIVLVLGFPVAVVLAWIFDLTPQGTLERTSAVEAAEPDEGDSTASTRQLPEVSLAIGDSQRRQVSILSCIFESASGSDPEIDPESLIDSQRDLKNASKLVANRFNGYEIPSEAGSLGFVFGYPQAREDDARRALSAGLALLNETKEWRERYRGEGAVNLICRIGVATGLVVVNERDSRELDVEFIGQTPRVASWMREQAPPDMLVIGPQTFRLIESYFRIEPLHVLPKTPFGDNVPLYCVRDEIPTHDMLQKELPLAGRDDELRLLESRWNNVVDGAGSFVLISGAPGIGKSSLVRSFYQRAVDGKGAEVLLCQCSAFEINTPLAPLVHLFQSQILRFEDEDDTKSRLDKLNSLLRSLEVEDEESVALLAGLLSLDLGDDSKPVSGSAENLRTRTLELVLDMISLMATRQPVLLIFEDIHWADPSTLEMIQMLINRGPASGLLVLFSTRPEFEADWVGRSLVLVRELHPLEQSNALELINSIEGADELPPALVDRIIGETDGNPLYIQELTRSLLESEQWRSGDKYDDPNVLGSLEIPATLHDSLNARVDVLGESKALLQLCSVLGREFSYEMVRAVSGTQNDAVLKDELSKLVTSEFLFQRGVLKNQTYTFKHVLIQETAYNSLLKSKRKELHGRIAGILQQEFPEAASRQPGLLAYHYTEAGDFERAIPCWTMASRQSVERFANQEAVQQSRRGIELLEKLPETPQRAAQEIPLQIVLGSALLPTKGYANPEVRKVFSRALELCETLGDSPELFRVAVGLWMYYVVAAEYKNALDIGQRLVRISESTGDPAQNCQAHYCLAFTTYYMGEFREAKSHIESAINSEIDGCDYTTQSPASDDTRVHLRVMLALVNWFLGYPKTGRFWLREAESIAHEHNHPWGIAFEGVMAAWFYLLESDPEKTMKFADEAAVASKENGFQFWLLLSNYLQAWANNRDPKEEHRPLTAKGVADMQARLEEYRGIGSRVGVTSLYFGLAEDYVFLGMTEQANELLDRGLEESQQTGESFFEPEYFRIRGQIHMNNALNGGQQTELDTAKELFEKSLADARERGASALELRTAVSMARLLSSKKENGAAADVLRGAIERYEERDESRDCIRASKLLRALEASPGEVQ